jgi:hypothetical protein
MRAAASGTMLLRRNVADRETERKKREAVLARNHVVL